MMFRLEIFVDDKKLSYVLWALTGHILGDPKIHPVVNATVKNGKVRAETSGDHVEMFRKHVASRGGNEFSPAFMQDWCIGLGLKRKSYSNILAKGIRAKAWKRVPQKGTKGKYSYIITREEKA